MAPARNPRKPELDPWMSLVEAARVLRTTRQTVLTLIVKGELEGQHIAGRTVVSRASVQKHLPAAS